MLKNLSKYQLIVVSIILAVGFIFGIKSATESFSTDKITVTGSAYKIVESDSACLEFEIMTKKPDKQQAYNSAKAQLPIVTNYLKENGITDIEIKAYRGYNTYRYTPNGNMTNDIAYFNLAQPIVINSNDVNKIKNISSNIQSLLDKGVDININSTQYFYSKLGDLKVELLEDATKDAKDRATAMLKATNNKPGKIKSVGMGVFQITPVNSTNVSNMGISDTSTIEKKVTAVANVTFNIK